MSQSHVTLAFPLKWPADANALAEKLPPLMPELLVASDLMGTIHYCRLAKRAGPVFELHLRVCGEPALTPVASQAMAFVDCAAGHPASGLT